MYQHIFGYSSPLQVNYRYYPFYLSIKTVILFKPRALSISNCHHLRIPRYTLGTITTEFSVAVVNGPCDKFVMSRQSAADLTWGHGVSARSFGRRRALLPTDVDGDGLEISYPPHATGRKSLTEMRHAHGRASSRASLPGPANADAVACALIAQQEQGLSRSRLSPCQMSAKSWWSRTESNRRPLQCHCSALPTELRPRVLGSTCGLARKLALPPAGKIGFSLRQGKPKKTAFSSALRPF